MPRFLVWCRDNWETPLGILAGVLLVLLVGCETPDTGLSAVVGEHTALPEVSDAGGDMTIRVYESVKGARVWSRQNSKVKIDYNCTTTNSYCFGLFEYWGKMKLKVDVEPLDMSGDLEPAN